MLRYLAKNIVAAGLADECLLQISYAIGLAEPLSLYINTNKTNKTDESKILAFIRNNIDLTPQGIINYLRLRQPIYLPTAAYGHFGRQPGSDGTFSWEKLDLTEQLKSCFRKQAPFFGRRKGRVIRKTKTTLLETFLPALKITEQTAFDRNTLFGTPVREICLEIGFGNGEHLAGQAKNNPQTGYIGAEVFQNGVANLLTLLTGIKVTADLPETVSLEPGRVDNIRIWDNDIRLLFKQIPDNFLDRVYLLFPDPWPKKRHASRRFVNPDNLKELARILKKAEY